MTRLAPRPRSPAVASTARSWIAACLALLGLSPACRGSTEVDYDAVFVAKRLAVWELKVDNDRWHQLLAAPATYVPAQVTVDGAVYANVGLRLVGAVNHNKKSLRLHFAAFEPQQDFHGLKHLNLRSAAGDPSLLREAMALELFRVGGVPAPRQSLVWVGGFGGGAGGVYTLVEQVDDAMLRRSFDEDSGELWRLEAGASLSYLDDHPESYDRSSYQLDNSPDKGGPTHLVELIAALNQPPLEQLAASLSKVLDLDAFLRALAINTWLANVDAYPGSGGNYYLYRDQSGRFRYIPWDLNQAFGNDHGEPCRLTTDALLQLDPDAPACADHRPLVERTLAVPALRARYHEHLRELLTGVLDPQRVIDRLHALREQIREAVARDTLKSFTTADFDACFSADLPSAEDPARVPALERFVTTRDAVVREALQRAAAETDTTDH